MMKQLNTLEMLALRGGGETTTTEETTKTTETAAPMGAAATNPLYEAPTSSFDNPLFDSEN